jgi:NAD(P)H-hydrate epimerase
MAIPASIQPQVSSSLLEAIWLLLDDEMGAIAEPAFELVSAQMEKATCFVLGPGLGRDETTVRFVKRLLMGSPESPAKSMGFVPVARQAAESEKLLPPFVIDADGLRILSTIPDWPKYIRGNGVLTPHPGEMAALTGLSVEDVQKDRESLAVHYARAWNQVVVLKGALTVIAEPAGKSVVIPVASSALAKAGSGDVLSGAIAGLMAQGVPAFSAAVAGSWYHAQAGLAAANQLGSERSVMAGDLIRALASVLR